MRDGTEGAYRSVEDVMVKRKAKVKWEEVFGEGKARKECRKEGNHT